MADDQAHVPSNNTDVLTFAQAMARAAEYNFYDDSQPTGELLTVADCCRYYLEETCSLDPKVATRTPAAAKQARYDINAHILDPLGHIPVDKLTRSLLRKWHRDLVKKPARVYSSKHGEQRERLAVTEDDQRARRSTANRLLTRLKAVLNYAHDDDLLSCSNAAWGRKLKPFAAALIEDDELRRSLTKDEVERLMTVTEGDFQALVAVALHTGARYGELSRLEVRDFDRQSRTLFIRKTKSGRSRYVPLDDRAYGWLESLTVGRLADDHILMNGNAPWGKSAQQFKMQRACKDAKIEPRVSFHELRHTFATTYIQNGGSIFNLKDTLGHSTTRMIEKHYCHPDAGYRQEQAEKFSPKYGIDPPSKVIPMTRAG
jgi:integrase